MFHCEEQCKYGFQQGVDGCLQCRCRDPCEVSIISFVGSFPHLIIIIRRGDSLKLYSTMIVNTNRSLTNVVKVLNTVNRSFSVNIADFITKCRYTKIVQMLSSHSATSGSSAVDTLSCRLTVFGYDRSVICQTRLDKVWSADT